VSNRRPLIAGNWKMYKTVQEARDFAVNFQDKVAEVTDIDMVICAPFTTLSVLKEELEESIVHIGAQNMYIEDKGAFTGEVSPVMLLDLACTYVVLGHSERREYFKEDDELIAKKVKKALDTGLTPILCVGENLALREDGKALGFVRGQVEKDLMDLTPAELSKVVIAYEPIWAIGTGRTASAEDAQEMCSGIRATLSGISGSVAQEMRILYGGSVKPDNVTGLMGQPDIDGALVGGASLKADSFAGIVNF